MILLAVLVTLWPLVYAGGIVAIGIWDPRSADEWIFGFAGVYVLLSLILAIVYSFCGRKRRLSGWSIAAKAVSTLFSAAMLVWLVSTWVAADIATQNGAMEAFLGVFLQILLLLPWLMADGFLRISLAVRCSYMIKPAEKISRLHILWHLIPVADVISAIFVHRQLKKPT